MRITNQHIKDAVKGYFLALLWANATCGVESCSDGREIGECEHTTDAHSRFDLSDLDSSGQASIRDDVESLIRSSAPDFVAYCEMREISPGSGSAAEFFGHDFALTRNGHGAGFWDRGLGAVGDRLTAAAEAYGSAYVVVGKRGVSLM